MIENVVEKILRTYGSREGGGLSRREFKRFAEEVKLKRAVEVETIAKSYMKYLFDHGEKKRTGNL